MLQPSITTVAVPPRRPFRILRGQGMRPQAIYYSTQASRDAAAARYAERDHDTVLTELWSAKHPQDEANRGWACDGVIHPATA